MSAGLLAGALAALLALPSQPTSRFELLGGGVDPGESMLVHLVAGESFAGGSLSIPVTVLHGARPGPILCLTGGIHGDELNGVEIVRVVLEQTDPEHLSGTLIGIPIVNLHGLRRGSRYLPDRRDLNRYFPGNPRGSSASRIAYAVFESVIRRCNFLVDFHSGSFHRANLPHVRADLSDAGIEWLASRFGAQIVVHKPPGEGTLRYAASQAGIPSLTYEAGEPMRFQAQQIERGVIGVRHMLGNLGMVDPLTGKASEQTHYFRARWVRVDDGGILRGWVGLGQMVDQGQLLATVTDPVSSERSEVRSPYRGRVIGRALDQLVLPGFAAFNIALEQATLVDGTPFGDERDDDADKNGDDPLEFDDRPE